MTFDLFWHKVLRRPYRLHVAHSGDPTKPVAVLLHGIAASGNDWANILTYLEPEYHCITIDLLGFGESPKPEWADYTMDDHMRSLYHTMNKLHLGRSFLLIGHSLGSFLAARYAVEHERTLTRLVLLSPPIYPPLGQIKRLSSRKLTGMLLAAYKFLRSNPRMTPANFKRLSYLLPLPRSIVDKPNTWLPFMRTLKECIERQTILSDTASLALPVDVFYGSLDQVVVNANVELLGLHSNVRLHKFVGTHDLTARYGKLLARTLETAAEPTQQV